jgi:GDPmannose 4,6-dehydratase
MKRALISGCTGQDGSYLSQSLVRKGYEVYGLIRGQNNPKKQWLHNIEPKVNFIEGDLTDLQSLIRAIEISQPDEVYNLGAVSFVGASWKQPDLTSKVTGLGALYMLDAIRMTKCGAKFYQASSSEMFGDVVETPQNELTRFNPQSPYGVAKAFAHHMTVNYRRSYDMYACSGICYNHESLRRGQEFVTRKITQAVARISLGLQDHLTLGNLDPMRDWGYAPDFVEAMWLMLQQDEPDDYVIATGEMHSIREFLDSAFECIGVIDWTPFVKQDERYMRPAEVNELCGDASKAKWELGWRPSVSFKELVYMMVMNDIKEANTSLK